MFFDGQMYIFKVVNEKGSEIIFGASMHGIPNFVGPQTLKIAVLTYLKDHYSNTFLG